MTTPLISLTQVRKSYPTQAGSEVLAVEDITLTVESGAIVALIGPSGCGKTTVLNMLAGFEAPTDGTVMVDGRAVRGPAPERAVVFQEPALFPWLNVRDNILFGPRSRGTDPASARRALDRLLSVMRLVEFARAYPRELSGGMMQRVAIARALINEPKVLLLDEPFGALDAQTRLSMQRYLMGIQRVFGTTTVLVTHDVDEAIYVSDRVAIMTARPGRIWKTLAVEEPRPRSRAFLTQPGFASLKREALDALGYLAGADEDLDPIALPESKS
jgi:NitT/TauT family transport system ATP-binding protein